MRRGKLGFWLRLAVIVLKPPLTVFLKRRWAGREHIPPTGGVLVVVNHISWVDPLAAAHFVYDAGRSPRFLAKQKLFQLPLVGQVLAGAGQIPVQRYSESAAKALGPATAALRRGECVVIYPEGTVTRDPAYWPMRAHTGVARLAVETGVPVVPVGQWGAQRVMGRDKVPHLLPRRTVWLKAGPPVDLSAYAGRELSAPQLREVTDLVMGRVAGLVAELRGEPAPAEFFDPRRGARVAADESGRLA